MRKKRKRVCIAALCAAVLFAGCGVSAAAGADKGKCVLRLAEERAVVPDDYGRPLIDFSLNGTSEKFLVDTAGIYSAVNPTVVTALGLELRSLPFHMGLTHTASGTEITKMTYIDHFRIGAWPVSHLPLVVMTAAEAEGEADGLIAGDLLHSFDVEFDPRNARMRFFRHLDCGGAVYWTADPHVEIPFVMNANLMWSHVVSDKDWHITFPATLNGVEVTVTLDTGAAASFLFSSDLKNLLPPEDLQKYEAAQKKPGQHTKYNFAFKTLNIGGLQIRHPHIFIMKYQRGWGEKVADPRPQIILGDNVLKKLHFYIAYEDKKLYITPASSH